MTYVSLYRRYRPQSFEDIVGQEHVTRTLVNALHDDRLHHAYLFTGPRGTGKTSTARILAKAVNCVEGPTPNPCNTCDNCVEITAGSSVDVIELDMASHGGVEDARELRDRAAFAPVRSHRKVYILDEVHMASTAAFNALLKLIEEPPEHVLFAMATTDPQKVLPTILSRVQRLDLRRVGADAVAAHVQRVCAAEGHGMDAGAVDAVVRAGDGSVRDTLSVLEQVLAFADGDVTAATVAAVLGRTPDDEVFAVAESIATRDIAGVLVAVQRLVDQGIDLRRFTLDFAQHVRDLLVCKVAPDRADLLDATVDRRQRLAAQAGALAHEDLIAIASVLGDVVAEQRQTSPRLPLELALARLAAGPASATPPAAANADAQTDDAVPAPIHVHDEPASVAVDDEPAPAAPSDEVAAAAQAAPTVSTSQPAPDAEETAATASPRTTDSTAAADGDDAIDATDNAEADGDETTVAADVPVAGTDDAEETDDGEAREADLARVRDEWDAILEAVKQQSRRGHALFEPAKPIRVGRGMLTLYYSRRYVSFHAANAGKSEFAELLRSAIKARCGLDLRLEIVREGEDTRRRPIPPSATPDDARTPVLHDPISPDDGDDEEVDVREAELAEPKAAHDVDGLLGAELGAELLEHRAGDSTGS